MPAQHPSPLAVLRDAMSAQELLATGVALTREIGRGDPFVHLGPSWSRREAACRAQARPAVWFYRALRSHLPPERALSVATAVIGAAGAQFIEQGLGQVDLQGFRDLDEDQARRKVEGWLGHFFTASAFIERVDPQAQVVAFKVSRCALARLAQAAGHPELTGAFCAADRRFFESQSPPIRLHRPRTIAEGSTLCDFTLSGGDR